MVDKSPPRDVCQLSNADDLMTKTWNVAMVICVTQVSTMVFEAFDYSVDLVRGTLIYTFNHHLHCSGTGSVIVMYT